MNEEVIQNEASSNTSPKKLTFVYETPKTFMKKKSKSRSHPYPAMNSMMQNGLDLNTTSKRINKKFRFRNFSYPIMKGMMQTGLDLNTAKSLLEPRHKGNLNTVSHASSSSTSQNIYINLLYERPYSLQYESRHKEQLASNILLPEFYCSNTVPGTSFISTNQNIYSGQLCEEPETYSMQDDACIETHVAEWARILVGESFNSQLNAGVSSGQETNITNVDYLSGPKIITSLYDITSDTRILCFEHQDDMNITLSGLRFLNHKKFNA
ncbi:23138_t:CDS:2 [Cetraspora pellucida]|uniref:23138_t:CDS:1 n=1 Tax=Cetraspora pellucida TaxID=1433469 RepID=A0A9N9I5N5_9GLOM|nr:23138_t:CDS:2 [Cetraspora pellucida]